VETDRWIVPLVTGTLLLLMSYGPSVYFGATSSLKADRALLVPVLGPWIDLASRPGCTSDPRLPVDNCTPESLTKVAIVASGLTQALGAVLFAVGLPSEAVLVKDDAPAPAKGAGVDVRVSPWGLRGSF
jgi:hypothetical protein